MVMNSHKNVDEELIKGPLFILQQLQQQAIQKKQQIDMNNAALYSQGIIDQGYGPRKFSKIEKKTNVGDMIS